MALGVVFSDCILKMSLSECCDLSHVVGSSGIFLCALNPEFFPRTEEQPMNVVARTFWLSVLRVTPANSAFVLCLVGGPRAADHPFHF